MNKMMQGKVDQSISLFTSRSGSRDSYHFGATWAILFHTKLYAPQTSHWQSLSDSCFSCFTSHHKDTPSFGNLMWCIEGESEIITNTMLKRRPEYIDTIVKIFAVTVVFIYLFKMHLMNLLWWIMFVAVDNMNGRTCQLSITRWLSKVKMTTSGVSDWVDDFCTW